MSAKAKKEKTTTISKKKKAKGFAATTTTKVSALDEVPYRARVGVVRFDNQSNQNKQSGTVTVVNDWCHAERRIDGNTNRSTHESKLAMHGH